MEIDRLIFVKSRCIDACKFALDIEGDKELEVATTELIRKGGGTIEDKRTPDTCGSRILLVHPESPKYKGSKGQHCDELSGKDVFSAYFIKDSVNAGKLVDLSKYRVNKRSIFENYDPLKVLLGIQKWEDLKQTFSTIIRSPRSGGRSDLYEEHISDIDEDKEMAAPVTQVSRSPKKITKASATSGSSSDFKRVEASESIKAAVLSAKAQKESNKKVSAWLSTRTQQNLANTTLQSCNSSVMGGRAPYTRKEEESIIRDIIQHRAFNRIRGVQYWVECQSRGEACKGLRTWQSMKERFRKKVK